MLPASSMQALAWASIPSLSTVGDKCAKDNLGDFIKSLTNFNTQKNPYNKSSEFFLSEYTKIDGGWGFAPNLTPQIPKLVSTGPLRGRRGMEGRTRGG